MDFSFKLFGDKYVECQAENDFGFELFNLNVGTRSNCDHGGFFFELQLLSFYVSFSIYDSRHWNYEEMRWYEPGEECAESELSDANLTAAGFKKKKGLPLFGPGDVVDTLDFYQKPVLSVTDSGVSSIVLNVYQEPGSEQWIMTDNWTKVIGPVADMFGVYSWEEFLKNKRLR